MRVRYRLRAQLDIENIHQYIEKQNPGAAAEVVARIRYAADRLGMLPYTLQFLKSPPNVIGESPLRNSAAVMSAPNGISNLHSTTCERTNEP
jgi:plasmid stabilization system protein ParE